MSSGHPSGGSRGASDLRLSCVHTLTTWLAPSPEQERLRLAYLRHLAERDDGWARQCPGAHLTASSLVCATTGQQVLLTLHAKLGRWLQTGGHLEADDQSLEAAALREAEEESGLTALTVDPVPLLLSRHELSCGGQQTFHLDVQFLVRTGSAISPRFGAESLDVRWFDPTQIPDVDQSVRDLISAASQRLRWT